MVVSHDMQSRVKQHVMLIAAFVCSVFAFACFPKVALADFNYTFDGGSTVTVSDDLSTVRGTAHVVPDAYSPNTGVNSTTFVVSMPDGESTIGYCLEGYQGLQDHLSYPEPGECNVPFVATRIGTSMSYAFTIDTTQATTYASWVTGSPSHVRQKVYVPSYDLPFGCSLRIDKTTGNASVTSGNNAYSLNGAIYGVYASRTAAERDRNREATITITATTGATTGTSVPVAGLSVGQHWVKELVAPDGFALLEEPVSVNLTPGNVNVLSLTEDVLAYAVPRVSKNDANGSVNRMFGQGDASLADAWIRLDYYSSMSASGSPARTWYLKTDADGTSTLDAAHLVGDSGAFYMADVDQDGRSEVVIPRGTLVVSEFKAPVGYRRNTGTLTILYDGTYQRPYGTLSV